MQDSNWVRALIILLTIIAATIVGGLVWQGVSYFADIIVIFFFAWLLSFLLGPAVARLTEINRLPVWVNVVIAYLGAIIVLALIGILIFPILIQQIGSLAVSVPTYFAPIPDLLANIETWLQAQGVNVRIADLYNVEDLTRQVQTIATGAAGNALIFAQGLAGVLFNVVLIFILSVYMLLDGRRLTGGILGVLPASFQADARFLLDSIDKTFGGFIRSLFVQGVIYGLGTAIVMLIAGLDFVLPVALFAGVAMVIPFIGPFLSFVPPLVIAGFTGEIWRFVLVLVGLGVLQQIVVNVIGPKVVGDALGLHPMVVLLALLIGIRVAGLWGAVFAIPLAGVIYAMGYSWYRRQRAASTTPQSL